MPVLTLPPVLDLSAATALHANLLAARGEDLEVDASEVQRLGGQCLQLLLAATKAWQTDGKLLRLKNASDPCQDALTAMGAGLLLGAEG
ncbi:MAG: hypothetical protein NVSMB18_26670 [Acetobacteraceae bacterium]